jgi:hypothetical protein
MYFKSLNGKWPLAVIICVLFSLASCKKNFPPIFKGGHSHSGNPVVLVAGYESDGTHNIAKYWVDGQEMKLSDGTRDATANSVRIVALCIGKIIVKCGFPGIMHLPFLYQAMMYT